MNAPQQVVVSPDIEIKMQEALKAQRESYLQEGFVSAETRIDRLNRAIDVLVRHADRISEAINKDFVCRPDQINLMTDVAASIGSMKHCRKHLKKWMKDDKRPSTFSKEKSNECPATSRSQPRYRNQNAGRSQGCLLYTSPSPRDRTRSRMPSSA